MTRMTLDEAIKYAEEEAMDKANFASILRDSIKKARYEDWAEEYRQFAELLKELKQYKEKDTPRLVVYSGDGYANGYMVYDMAECPNCEREFEYGRDEWDMPYCCACGQALKWESEDTE